MNVFRNLYDKIHLEKHCNEFDYTSIPDALLKYHRDSIFSSWQILELQLSQVNPIQDPEIYQALDERANILFLAWLQFRYVRGT